MLSFGIRVFVFLVLFLAGLTWGWEFMVAGLIFAANMLGVKLEYLFLGLSYDLLLSFPAGFFTAASLIILLATLALGQFFKETNLSSFSVKLFAVSLAAALVIFFYFLKSFWPEFLPALKFASFSFLKIFLFLAVFTLLSRIIESFYGRKISAE